MAQVAPISLAIGTAIQPIEDPIDLARHDKIVLVQSLDLLGAQRDGRVTPAEADIGMMSFGFSQVTDVANKAERFLSSERLLRSGWIKTILTAVMRYLAPTMRSFDRSRWTFAFVPFTGCTPAIQA